MIFYGREDADLASQLLLLPPGQYRIQMDASGDAGGASGLEWSVTCLPGKATLASIPLNGATLAGKRLGGTFTVPGQACAAQWLKLTGTAKEFAKSEQVTIGKLRPFAGGRPMTRSLRLGVDPLYLMLCIVLGGSSRGHWANMVLQLLGDRDHRLGRADAPAGAVAQIRHTRSSCWSG